MKEGERDQSVLQSARANGDWIKWPTVHLIKGSGREEVMRKGGGGEARSVRGMLRITLHLKKGEIARAKGVGGMELGCAPKSDISH